MENGYNENLSKEWIDWVENNPTEGTREKEIFPIIQNWVLKNKSSIKTIVDLGCGQGICSEFIGDDIDYIGIDASNFLLEKARKKYQSQTKKFVLSDLYNLNVEDNFTDAALSIWVWSHLEKLEDASTEMFRILKNKGKILLITASPSTYEERISWYTDYKIEGKLLKGTMDLGNEKYLSNTTLYLHTQKEIVSSLEQAGFTIIEEKEIGGGMYLLIELVANKAE